MAGFIAFQGPETAAVRCQHFIAQDNAAIFIQTELELGVGNDDASAEGVIRAFLIQSKGIIPDLLRVLLPVAGKCLFQDLYRLLEADVLVMIADFRLGAGRIDGFRQLIAFFQARGKFDPAYSAVLLIAGPAAAGDISPDDALNGDHPQFSAEHAAAVKTLLTEELGHIVDIHTDHMVGKDIAGQIEPESGHLGQDLSLVDDLILQDDIKSGDAVGGDHDQVFACIIDLTYFTFFYGTVFFHGTSFLLPEI